jgi:hypothetical protein
MAPPIKTDENFKNCLRSESIDRGFSKLDGKSLIWKTTSCEADRWNSLRMLLKRLLRKQNRRLVGQTCEGDLEVEIVT